MRGRDRIVTLPTPGLADRDDKKGLEKYIKSGGFIFVKVMFYYMRRVNRNEAGEVREARGGSKDKVNVPCLMFVRDTSSDCRAGWINR